MSALSIQPTFPIFTDTDGSPLENGYIWIGTVNQPAQTNPITVYWDAALTITATQPIRTQGGYPSRNGTPARLYVNSDYSIQVQNKNGSVLYSAPAATERIASSLITYTPGPNSLLTATTVQGALDQLSDDEDGSSYVGFLQAGTNAVATTVQAKLRETVSVKDFGAVGDGVTDDTAAIQAAVAAIAANPSAELIFPEGTYRYSVSPNFAITNATYRAQGNVTLEYTGIGNCIIFDAGVSGLAFNVRFLGNFLIKGTSAAQNGIYLRSVHHSKIEARILGCGTTYAGLRTEFSVVSEFNVVVSANEFGGFGSAKPANGYYLSSRSGAGEQTSACTFYNPVIEGVSGDGIYLHSAIKNSFIGGASQGNTGYGINVATSNAKSNTFYGIDLEVNAAGDAIISGPRNHFIDCLSDSTFNNTSVNTVVTGGIFTNITNTGSLSLYSISYSGSLTNSSGTSLSKYSVYNVTGARYDTDLHQGSRSITVNCVSGAPTNSINLPTTGNNFYSVIAYLPGLGSAINYSAIAVIAQASASAVKLSGTDGGLLTIALSGTTIVVTQTAGSNQNVVVVAQPI